MKKSLLAAAVLSAVSFGAHADGVELYGLLDAAVISVSNGASIDPQFPSSYKIVGGAVSTSITTSVTGLASGGLSGSRWGIKGSEDIGGGLKGIFALESGINVADGQILNGHASRSDSGTSSGGSSTNGQLFGRQAWVGLKDAELGEIRLGRNYSLMYDVYGDYAVAQNAQLFSATGNSGTLGGGGGLTENLRLDNSVKYVGKNGNVNYAAVYKFGNTAGSTSHGTAYSAQVGYTTDTFGVQAVYMGSTDTVSTISATAALMVNSNSYLLAAKYKFNDSLTGKVSYQRFNIQNPSDSVVSTDNVYYTYAVTTSVRTLGSAGASLSSIGIDYRISDKLGLYVGYSTLNNDANVLLKAGNAATSSSNENHASLLLDYNLSKRTDVYVAGMNVTTSVTGAQNTNIVGAGLRTKF